MPEHVTHDGLALVVERPPAGASDAGPPGAPVLLVHGIFVGAASLGAAQRYLASRGHPCIAVNLRGRFGSRPVAAIGRASIDDFTRDVLDAAAWVEREHQRPPVLLGHSMGGLLVQKALESGLRAPAAVLVCPAPPRGILALTPRIVRRMTHYLPSMLFSRATTFRAEDAYALALNRVPAERRDAIYARDFVPDSGRALRQIALGVSVDAARVRVPMLAITGADDRFVPPGTVRRIAARYGADFREYPGHGHVPFEEPDGVRPMSDLADWIAEATGGTSSPDRGT